VADPLSNDLFRRDDDTGPQPGAGLARRMRPRTLDEYAGQSHILAEGKLLRRAIEADRLFSVVLYGPPGVGKTSLTEVMARSTGAALVAMNAVEAGVADLRRAIGEARTRRPRRTILFLDEVHRFNKSQQDVLLGPLEDDAITMVGATVENPFFYLNPALLSRVQVFELAPLDRSEIRGVLERALEDEDRGLGEYRVEVDGAAFDHIVENALGDARRALGALELAVLSTQPDRNGLIRVGIEAARDCLRKRVIRYDRRGDWHYDVASALIKSIRGSQPNAALHWMARMLSGGEDPRFIARRLVISASEDIGLADPSALGVAVAAARAVEMLGLPEARYALAEAAIYLATAPKSRTAADAIARALEDIEEGAAFDVPEHLRSASYDGASRLGHGAEYEMPASESEGRVQEYLPEERSYYRPSGSGYEREVRRRLDEWDVSSAGSDDHIDDERSDEQARAMDRNDDR